MKKKILLTFAFVGLAAFASAAAAQTKLRVKFVRGASSSSVSGTVRGYAYMDYVVRASAGQTIDAKLDRNTKCVFTIFKPGGDNLDMAAEQDSFTGELPDTGDYVIRVLMMRSNARRPGAVSNHKLTISIR